MEKQAIILVEVTKFTNPNVSPLFNKICLNRLYNKSIQTLKETGIKVVEQERTPAERSLRRYKTSLN